MIIRNISFKGSFILFCLLGLSACIHANSTRATLQLCKIESNLWESTAAVYFHAADHLNKGKSIALNDYIDDVNTINDLISKIESEKQLTQIQLTSLSGIKQDWKEVNSLADEIIKFE